MRRCYCGCVYKLLTQGSSHQPASIGGTPPSPFPLTTITYVCTTYHITSLYYPLILSYVPSRPPRLFGLGLRKHNSNVSSYIVCSYLFFSIFLGTALPPPFLPTGRQSGYLDRRSADKQEGRAPTKPGWERSWGGGRTGKGSSATEPLANAEDNEAGARDTI